MNTNTTLQTQRNNHEKAKMVKSAGEVMAVVYFNDRWIIHIDYLEKNNWRVLPTNWS